MSNSNGPLNEFIEKIQIIDEHVDSLKSLINNHLNVDPDNASWGNVGDATRLLTELKGILERFDK